MTDGTTPTPVSVGRRTFLRTGLAAAAAGIAGCAGDESPPAADAGATPTGRTPAVPSTTSAPATGSPGESPSGPATTTDLSTSDFTPESGPGTPPPGANPDALGPWATGIRLAESTDGLTFSPTGRTVSDRAGVPDAIVDDEGRLRIYYVAWAAPSFGLDVGPDFLAVAIDDGDGGWTYKRLLVEGGPRRGPGYVDPTVVTLGDGRYRLFYMADVGDFTLEFFSATSTDGVHFQQDPGERLTPDDPAFDPMVLQTDAGWWLWGGPDGSHSARSVDGLEFDPQGPFMIGDRRFHPWAAVALPDGDYRLYGDVVGESGLRTARSDDGTTWTIESGDRSFAGLDATDVGVTVRPDGSFVMAYLTNLG